MLFNVKCMHVRTVHTGMSSIGVIHSIMGIIYVAFIAIFILRHISSLCN